MQTKQITIEQVRQALTNEGITFRLSKRLDEPEGLTLPGRKWILEIYFADDSTALDFGLSLGKSDLEALSELFTIEGEK